MKKLNVRIDCSVECSSSKKMKGQCSCANRVKEQFYDKKSGDRFGR